MIALRIGDLNLEDEGFLELQIVGGRVVQVHVKYRSLPGELQGPVTW